MKRKVVLQVKSSSSNYESSSGNNLFNIYYIVISSTIYESVLSKKQIDLSKEHFTQEVSTSNPVYSLIILAIMKQVLVNILMEHCKLIFSK